MNAPAGTRRPVLRHGLALLVTVALAHLLTVWALPRVAMYVVMNGPEARAMDMRNRAVFVPPVTARSRSVVMPSPDLLYAVCVFDVSHGAVHVTANPQLDTYWSIALYAANSDNFFVLNDHQAAGQPVDLWLLPPDGATSGRPLPPGAQGIVPPSREGFLVLRVLTGDYEAEKSVLEPARRTLSCQPT